jgi:hypothetical protein
MKKQTFIKIQIILSLITTSKVFAQNSWNDATYDKYITKLASNLKSSSSNSASDVLQKIAEAYGRYQLEEFEKANPQIRKITKLEISLGHSNTKEKISSKNIKGVSEKSNNSNIKAFERRAKKSSELKFKVNSKNQELGVIYKNNGFNGYSFYSLPTNSVNLKVTKNVNGVNGAINYNTQSSKLLATAQTKLSKDFSVGFSAGRKMNSEDSFAGFNLNLGF